MNDSTRNNGFLGEALAYAGRGFSVVPANLRTKRPALAAWKQYQKRRPTTEELKAWTWPGVGIVTGPISGLLTLDVDGDRGRASLDALEAAHGPLPATWTARTGSGGMHYYFRYPIGGEVRNSASSKLGAGLDIRGAGGFVVAPPTIRADGGRYEWIDGPDAVELAAPPAWLMKLLLTAPTPSKNGGGPRTEPVDGPIIEGARNDTLTSFAGTIRNRGATESEILAYISTVNRERCAPPLPDSELKAIARSVAGYGLTKDATSADKKPATPTHDELAGRWLATGSYAYGMGSLWAYEGGIYVPMEGDIAKRGVAEVVTAAKPEGVRPTANVVDSVFELARVRVAVAKERWDADPDVLVCRNGALHIPSRELRGHSPEHYATSTVPYGYEADAAAPVWRYFLGNTVPDAAGLLQEFAGYALTTDTSLETALWLYGPPGCGKSTFLAGLMAMLGQRAGTLGLAEIERNRFALATLPGKTLVVATEQPSSYLASTNTINALISGEPLAVERKFRDPYTLIPHAKVAWAMNELPRVADANSGLFRRVKVVEFPALAKEDRDPKVKRCIEDEGAGILNWALEGLARLRERGGFTVPASVQAATDSFKESNDVPALFVADRCIMDGNRSVAAGELYREYKDWCLENGHKPQSATRLAEDWKRLGFERYASKGKKRYRGVALDRSGTGALY